MAFLQIITAPEDCAGWMFYEEKRAYGHSLIVAVGPRGKVVRTVKANRQVAVEAVRIMILALKHKEAQAAEAAEQSA